MFQLNAFQSSFQEGAASQVAAPSLDAFQGVQQDAFQGFGGVQRPLPSFSITAFQGMQQDAFQATAGWSSQYIPPLIAAWDTRQGKAPSNLKFTPIRDAETRVAPVHATFSVGTPSVFSAAATAHIPPVGLTVWAENRKPVVRANSYTRLKHYGAFLSASPVSTTSAATCALVPVYARFTSLPVKISTGATTDVAHQMSSFGAITRVRATAVQNPSDEEIAVLAKLLGRKHLTSTLSKTYSSVL